MRPAGWGAQGAPTSRQRHPTPLTPYGIRETTAAFRDPSGPQPGHAPSMVTYGAIASPRGHRETPAPASPTAPHASIGQKDGPCVTRDARGRTPGTGTEQGLQYPSYPRSTPMPPSGRHPSIRCGPRRRGPRPHKEGTGPHPGPPPQGPPGRPPADPGYGNPSSASFRVPSMTPVAQTHQRHRGTEPHTAMPTGRRAILQQAPAPLSLRLLQRLPGPSAPMLPTAITTRPPYTATDTDPFSAVRIIACGDAP